MLNMSVEVINITNFNSSKFIFNGIDYGLFAFMLSISAAIGIYFGFIAKSADTTDEYLMGGKKMKSLPIAISLVASQLSAVTIMTIPSEIYQFGIHYVLKMSCIIIVLPIMLYIITPVFYNNNISNCYQYLQMRFDKRTRQLVTIAFVIKVYLIIPVIIYIPSLAFSQVTGYNVHAINVIVCSICIFYTMLGGIKAVVWTDVVQAGIMLGSVLLVAILAINKIGGIGEVLERSIEGERLSWFNMELNLSTRTTFWNSFFGGITAFTSYIAVHQSCVQRIVSLPSLKQAQISLMYFTVGFILVMGLNCFTGLIMYARYYLCDPIAIGLVEKADKLVPFFVQDVVGSLKGIPGIFISCVFSAALSTMSANINTLAGLVYFDYIRPFIKHSDSRANYIMKTIVIINGIYCILGGFVVAQFSSLFQVVLTISGMTQGAVAGIFLFGMLYPRAHARAAFYATVSSMSIMSAIVINTVLHENRGEWKYQPLPTRMDGCSEFNITIASNSTSNIRNQEEYSIFRISFYWYTFIGCFLVWLIGIPLTHLLENNSSKKLDIKLISPLIQKYVPQDLLKSKELPEEFLKHEQILLKSQVY